MRPSDDTRRDEPVECRLSDMADGQQGLVAHAQLLSLGLTRASIQRRRRSGYLLPTQHEGVYAVGHAALAPLARDMGLLSWPAGSMPSSAMTRLPSSGACARPTRWLRFT